MTKFHNATAAAAAIMAAWNRNAERQTECFYAGIRADMARWVGVAPNNPAFNAGYEMLDWYQSGDGLLYAYLR